MDYWDALNVINGHVEVKLAEGADAKSSGHNNIDSWRGHYWFIGQQIAAVAASNKGWLQAESLVPPGSPI